MRFLKGIIKYVLPFLILPALLVGGHFVQNYILPKVAKSSAAKYIAAQYPGNDFDIVDAQYSFKAGLIIVEIQSHSSRDTNFDLYYTPDGTELAFDSYENVSNGATTLRRIVREYDALVQPALAGMPLHARAEGDFCRYSEELDTPYFNANGIREDSLQLDAEYDLQDLGAQCGYIELYFWVDTADVTYERASGLLKEADRLLSENGVAYAFIEIYLYSSEDEDDTYLSVDGITPEDIRGENLPQRLAELDEARKSK